VSSLRDLLIQQWAAMSVPEALAVLLAIAYLLLVIRESIWCWLCALVSSAIYVWLFIEAKLYMESLLYVFYSAMAVYGWWSWRRRGTEDSSLQISTLPGLIHLWAIIILTTIAMSCGFILYHYTDAAWPYVDSMTTFAAIWATFLVARKVFENWWYWLVIDLVSIFIYWNRGLELTAALFVMYVVLIPVGMMQWWRSYKKNAANLP